MKTGNADIMTMTRPQATRTLALNGLTITATISNEDDALLNRCCQDEERRRFEYEMKCRQRQEYYDGRNREKTIENSKNSLDLMYEKKRGVSKSLSTDFHGAGTKKSTGMRESSADRISPAGEGTKRNLFERPNGMPRSMSDIPETEKGRMKRWSEAEFYATTKRISRKDKCLTFVPIRGKKSSEAGDQASEFNQVTVEVKSGKVCRNGERDKLFRNSRSRSATIPRKWSEHSLSTPSTTSVSPPQPGEGGNGDANEFNSNNSVPLKQHTTARNT